MINAIHRRPAGKYLAGILGARLAVARAPPPFPWLGALYTWLRALVFRKNRAPNHHRKHDESRARRRASAHGSDPATSDERVGLSGRNGYYRNAGRSGTSGKCPSGRGTNVSTAQSAISCSVLRRGHAARSP